MPRPSDYTPARRMMMRAIMVLLLAGTLALAGVVGHALRAARQVALDDRPLSESGLSVRLPKHWKLRARGLDPRIIAAASEGSGKGARTIEILCQRLERPLSPMQFLSQTMGLDIDAAIADDQADPAADTPAIAMAQQQGVMIAFTSASKGQGARSMTKHVYACAITPGLQAVVVHLQGEGVAGVDDLELVRSVASSISLDNDPRLESEGAGVRLFDGMSCAAPSGFAPVEQSDPNRTDRLFWPVLGAQGTAEQLERNWATIEVVGCLWPADELAGSNSRGQVRRAMLTLLAARDPAWIEARVEPAGDHQWRAELNPSGACAYLRSDPSGRALLAIFHGGIGGGAFNAAWKQLADSTRFDAPTVDLKQCEQNGSNEVQRLRGLGYDELLAGRDEQWWLLLDSSPHPHIGWRHLDFDLNSLAGTLRSCNRLSSGSIRRVEGEWNYRRGAGADSGTYRADMIRRDSAGGITTSALRQLARLSNGRLILTSQMAPGAASQFEQTAPAQFVPGQILPLLAGRFSAKPMLLRSESFPMCEASGAADLLAILILPATAHMGEGASGQRCLTMQVNGSGRLSRWYFNADGELASIEFAGGRRCVPSDGKTIKFDFADEPGMSP